MRKGVPLTNREKRGGNQYENAFLQKNEVGEDHLKLLFPLGRSSRGLTLFAPFEKVFKTSNLYYCQLGAIFGTKCDVNGVAVDAYGLILCQNEAYHSQKAFPHAPLPPGSI